MRHFGYLPLEESFQSKKETKVNISHKLNQPAGLTSYFYISKSAGGMEALENRLIAMDLIVKVDGGILSFAYTENLINTVADEDLDTLLAERGEIFCAWVKGFLTGYHWNGINKEPEEDQLATRFGYFISADDKAREDMVARSHFIFKNSNRTSNIWISAALFSKPIPSDALPGPYPSEIRAYNYSGPNGILLDMTSQVFIDSKVYGPIPVIINLSISGQKSDVDLPPYIKGVYQLIEESIIATML